MTRKITRIRNRLKEAQKGLKLLEETWQYDPNYIVKKKCNNCNTVLEDEDLEISIPELLVPGDSLHDTMCGFCGSLV